MTEVKRSDLCDSCAHVNLPTNKTCDTEWAPNYMTPGELYGQADNVKK
jgi:hypothetical protein